MKKNLPEVIIITETKKISKSNTAIQYTLKKGERLLTAQTFLSVMQIISKSSQIILNSGNVGLWTCLYRRKFDGVHQFLSRINNNEKNWIE
jgi:nitrogen-specific signal transduction histidine kinase